MKLVVFSHKLVWKNPDAPTGYATDGGFAFHMDAISQIFDETTVAVPVSPDRIMAGEIQIAGHNIKIFPFPNIKRTGPGRKVNSILWFIKHFTEFNRLINQADAVHIPIPSDIGTFGMLLAKVKNKRMFIRYCGNWNSQSTRAEKFWKWFMEKYAGGKNIMLATGFQSDAPSARNKNIKWIFSSSLPKEEIEKLRESIPVLDQAAPKLIIVCRMSESKGVNNLIETVDLLKSDFPGINLDLVGDGEDIEKFKAKVISLKLEKHVKFHGKLNHEGVLKALQNANIFCFPTKSEGFPKAVLEALACGLPVVANPVSAIPDLLKNGGGILLEKDNPETIAKVLRAIFRDSDNYRFMQLKALETASAFSLENWRDTIKLHLKNSWKIN